jgi:hypothetical protein
MLGVVAAVLGGSVQAPHFKPFQKHNAQFLVILSRKIWRRMTLSGC